MKTGSVSTIGRWNKLKQITMKQIEFTLDAFGPDGMLKEGYEVTYHDLKLLFIKYNKGRRTIAIVFPDGSAQEFQESFEFSDSLKLYRRTRTAEEVAREVVGKNIWNTISEADKRIRIRYTQAGMDEMK
jgi:hypothetical protein